MSTGNPMIPQGLLNRVRGSVTFPLFPQLTITAPFLGKEGINMTLEGDITDNIGTMTGTVQSQAVYQMATVEIELLKTQFFADLWKQQLERDSNLVQFTVRTDAVLGLGNYQVYNANIYMQGPGRLNGTSVSYMIGLRGYYLVNSNIFNLA